MNEASLITVVIALKNDAAGLARTLASMRGQNGSNRLVIRVMDSNSHDFPIDVVDEYRRDLLIDFASSFDRGIYHAWNKALATVATPWLTFFGAGDTFCDGAIGALVDHVASERAADIVSSKSRNIFGARRHVIGGRPFDYEEFKRRFSVNHSGLLYRRSVFERWGDFDERYRSSADYEFLIRIGRRARFDFIDMIVSDYIVGGISSSSTMPLRETFRVRKQHRTTGRIGNYRQLLHAYAAFYWSRLRRR